MLGFLQGFAYGLFLSCIPWFIAGMVNPAVAVPNEPPSRWHVILRYWLGIPFLAFLLWLTSLWGGFGPTLAGWIVGLVAIGVEVPLERAWRRWLTRRREKRRRREQDARQWQRRAEKEARAREAGVAVLDPDHPPEDADSVVQELCSVKKRLQGAQRADLAVQVDRLYSRYSHGLAVLGARFDPGELTYQRAAGLMAEVCRGALDTFQAMASQAASVAGVDADYVRGRLRREGDTLPAEERQALERRLELLRETEQSLKALGGRNEAVITALDDATVAVARIETARPHASVAAERALQDLQRFVDGAGRYQRSE
ncbi:cobyrinic acid a,c-diamide synthase [Aquisalimonas sp.]|uniref:cobyrinic acid a,c-diamide synthase n=1 Tax=Aquisalimonas sp. TaxID=1872621 RepID=UPI0025C494E0|nr:cobyrinic acid a,c-diamide synthase [Aquisalimonas sp.]